MSATSSTPIITVISPSTVKIHADNVTLSVKGDNFNDMCYIVVEGSFLSTTFVNAGELTTILPRAITDVLGRKEVKVHDTKGGGISNSKFFDVQ
jgi:hypothetical protein